MSDKYRMPEAMPRSIPTSCMMVNIPSLFYTSHTSTNNSHCVTTDTVSTVKYYCIFISKLSSLQT